MKYRALVVTFGTVALALFAWLTDHVKADVRPYKFNTDWSDYRPKEPLAIDTAYKSVYTEVIFVVDRVQLIDGTRMLIVQNLQGRWCLAPNGICAIPADRPRGLLFTTEVSW